MTLELLKTFCSTDVLRHAITEPFSAGGFTYATTGLILLRVPLLRDVPERPDAPKLDEAMDKFPKPDVSVEWFDFPIAPEKPAKEPTVICDDCSGSGEVRCSHCDNWTDCEECGGTGQIESSETIQAVLVGNRKMNGDHLRLIATLPNPKAAINHGGGMDPIAFKFDGGIGLVMPLRP
jgi:hypothetical protein